MGSNCVVQKEGRFISNVHRLSRVGLADHQESPQDRRLVRPVTSNGIRVDPSKIEAVKNWKVPKTPFGIRLFLELAGKVENAIAEMLCGLNQPMERKECGGADKTYYDLRDMYGGHYWTDTNLHVHVEEIKVDKTLRFAEEPVEIIDRKVKSLKRSRISIICYVAISTLVWASEVVSSGFPIVKVKRDSKHDPKFTRECEDHMKAKYPR
ncbi:hypothetical protein Tco_1320341 [Tanacetum coccineum]